MFSAPCCALGTSTPTRCGESLDLLEAEADFVGRFGADGAGDFDAVFQENRGGPEFYVEGSAERAAFAVFHFDMFDGWEFGERFR